MLFTKSQGNHLLVLEKKFYKKVFFNIYGSGGHPGHVTKIFCINKVRYHKESSYKI